MERSESHSVTKSEDIDDPITDFLEEMRMYGRSESTITDYETTLKQFTVYVDRMGDVESVGSVNRRDCLSWIQHLRDEGYAPGSIHTKAVHLNRFYGYMAQVGVFESNPMVVVMEEMSERGDSSPTRREMSIQQMAEFVGSTIHPLRRAVLILLVKTGVRAGELCNIDIRDINIDHHRFNQFRKSEVRPAVRGHPDTLFISSGIDVGDVVNGEKRKEGNKRHRDTLIPIDDELKNALIRWLAIRPDPESKADALFVSTAESYGVRLTTSMVHSRVREAAELNGWYTEGAGPEENVTPHYFRHFFTTEMRNRLGDAYVVKYIRGDVGDVMDRYTHNWTGLVEKPYSENVFKLFD